MSPIKAPSKSFAVRVAMDWHEGPETALYSFASAGGVVHSQEHKDKLTAEVRAALEWVRKRNEARARQLREYRGPDDFGKEPHRLNRLLEFINLTTFEVE